MASGDRSWLLNIIFVGYFLSAGEGVRGQWILNVFEDGNQMSLVHVLAQALLSLANNLTFPDASFVKGK